MADIINNTGIFYNPEWYKLAVGFCGVMAFILLFYFALTGRWLLG